MNRRKISILLVLSLILTGSIGVCDSYASEDINVINEVLETTPVTDYEVDDTDVSNERPEGVVQQVFKTTPVDENGNEAKGTQTQEITGSSSMPDPSELGLYARDVVNMVMPVIPEETYDFVMDSQDLLSRYSVYKDSYEKASLYFTNTTGEKTHTGISDVAMAKNKSSIPVLLYVTLQVENENEWPLKYTDMDSVEADNEMNLSFALIPVASDPTGKKTLSEDSVQDEAADDDIIIYKDRMISIDETGKAEMILYLPGTPDNFDMIGDKYMAKEDAVWSSLGFAVTGACNTKADWSPIDERSNSGERIKMRISYRMDLLTEEQEEMIENGLKPDPKTGVIVFDTDENKKDSEGTEDEEGQDGNKEIINENNIADENIEDNKKIDTEDPEETEEHEEETIEDKEELSDGL